MALCIYCEETTSFCCVRLHSKTLSIYKLLNAKLLPVKRHVRITYMSFFVKYVDNIHTFIGSFVWFASWQSKVLFTKLSEQSCFGPPTCGAKHMVFTNPLHNTYTIGLDVCSPLRVSKSNIYTPTSHFPTRQTKKHLVKLDHNFHLFFLDALGSGYG